MDRRRNPGGNRNPRQSRPANQPAAPVQNMVFQPKKVPHLIVITDINAPVTVVKLNRTMTFGRPTPLNVPDISVDDGVVSRNHGVFELVGEDVYYWDARSLNGTYINDVHLPPDSKIKLFDGDILRIDNRSRATQKAQVITMIFSLDYDRRSKWEMIPVPQNRQSILGTGNNGHTETEDKKVVNRVLLLESYGGVHKCYPMVSGILRNSRPLVNEKCLKNYDVLKYQNNFIFYYQDHMLFNACHVGEGGLAIDLRQTVVSEGFKKKTLLKDVHADIDYGDFALIIGGSGAGKSTLVNSILGKYKMEGTIKIGGKRATKANHLMDNIAYVPQTLPLRKEEKLIDVITDTAILRMNGKMSEKERNEFIRRTLDSVGLGAKANMEIKKLSGGEQRRAAIANEIVTNSSIFFLDEPDSGLDPKSGMELMNQLRSLADSGKIVMLISHNYASYPNPEKIYTKVIILAKSNKDGIGRLAFMGPVDEALEFFGVKELKDITRLINPKSENGEGRADEFVEKYRRMTGV